MRSATYHDLPKRRLSIPTGTPRGKMGDRMSNSDDRDANGQMSELRESVALPLEVDLREGACAELVATLASDLAPGLEQSVGPVHWTEGDKSGVDWTVEGFVEGVFVVVCLRPSTREVSLLVDPRFARPAGPSSTANYILLGILGASVALGVVARSVGWAVLFCVGAVGMWIGIDGVRERRRVRRAVATLDRAGWSSRFHNAVGIASRSE
jgi:hypothetical protein